MKILVVCSGGLDSSTSAAFLRGLGHHVELVHFLYQCKAQTKEMQAVKDVAKALGAEHRFVDMPIWNPEDSALTLPGARIANGEDGAAVAHEWVPARNLVMLSVATAIAESQGFDRIALGINKEEADAYPDNSLDFLDNFNQTLRYAVAKGRNIEVMAPVAHMMKTDIVRLGRMIGAPLDKTWSCYHDGDIHCGDCGPCFMRKRAFAEIGIPDVIQYEK